MAGYVDVLLQPRGFEPGYQALAGSAVTMTVSGVNVLVGALDDLITSKRLLARAKDLAHLPALEAVARATGTNALSALERPAALRRLPRRHPARSRRGSRWPAGRR